MRDRDGGKRAGIAPKLYAVAFRNHLGYRAYAAHEVAFHQAVLDAVNGTLLPAVTNPELKAFVQKAAPAFQGHLEAAKQLQKSVGGAS